MTKKKRQFAFIVKPCILLLIFFAIPSCSLDRFIAKSTKVEYCHTYTIGHNRHKMETKEAITLFQDGTFNADRESYNLGGKDTIKGKGLYKREGRFLILTCDKIYSPGVIRVEEVVDTTINGYLFIATNVATNELIENCELIIRHNSYGDEAGVFPRIYTNELGVCRYDSTEIESFYIFSESPAGVENHVILDPEANVFKISVFPNMRDSYYFSNRRFFILNRKTLINKTHGRTFYFKRCK